MSKPQTRRSISLSRPIYDDLKGYCERNNLSMASFVEKLINERIGYGTRETRPAARSRWDRQALDPRARTGAAPTASPTATPSTRPARASSAGR